MPVIGGLCHLDSPDVHIGGKQTQFFLRCEPISESALGEGVWVVKSKNIGLPTTTTTNIPRIPAAALIKSEQQQIRKISSPKMSSYICDLVSDAYEHGFCSVSENCLQPVYTDRNAFLQCDSTTRRWNKKHCQPSFNFDFERQACIAHTVVKQGHHHFRQFPEYIDIICLNTLCSKNDPCNFGICDNGYCCFFKNKNKQKDNLLTNYLNVFHLLGATETIQNSNFDNNFNYQKQNKLKEKPSFILFLLQNDFNSFNNIPQNNILKNPTTSESTNSLNKENHQNCQNSLNSYIRCGDLNQCPPGFICKDLIKICCPSTQPNLSSELQHRRVPKWMQIPNENNQQKIKLRKRIGRNACPGGLPVLGQCIDGRCMSPAVCSTPANVCCAQTIVPTAIPATVCPDGTQAAGACVNGQCGAGFTCNQGLCCSNSSQTPRCLDGSQSIGACIQGRCGTGYTCTTGNICCPSQLNPCPPGQVSIGLAVNGRCPTGYTLISGQCCGTQSSQLLISCPQIDSSGPCDKNQQCSEPGFACDKANNWCCPQVFENEDPIGPCIEGEGGTRLCPEGYACVGDGEGECKRLDTGTCAPEEQLGPCGPNNECPAGYECIEGFCCRIDNGGRNGNIRRYRRGTTKSIVLQLIKNNSADREVHTN